MNARKSSLAVIGLVFAAGGGVASAQTVGQSAQFGTVLEYATSGCDGAVVQTPLPNEQFLSSGGSKSASAQWFYAQAAAHHVTWVTSLQCTHTGRTHVLVPAFGAASTNGLNNGLTSSNWSGYQINNTAQYTQAGWTVPAVAEPPRFHGYSDRGYGSSIWSGIGGGFGTSASDPLIQSGSAQSVDIGGNSHYYFWFEIVGGPTDTTYEIKVSSLAVHPGDFVANVAYWTPYSNQTNLGAAHFGLCNYTVNQCVDYSIADTPQPGDSTEWIVEAPTQGSTLPLADFGSVHFVNGLWTSDYTNPPNSTAYTIAQGVSLTPITLQQYFYYNNADVNIYATPGPLDSNGKGFTDTFSGP